MIEQSDERCFAWEQVLSKFIEKFVSHGKKISHQSDSSQTKNLETIKPFLTLEQRRHFFSSKQVAARNNCCKLVCACPSDQLKLCMSAAPSSTIDFASAVKTFDCPTFWNSLQERSPDDLQELELWLKLELCCLRHLTNEL